MKFDDYDEAIRLANDSYLNFMICVDKNSKREKPCRIKAVVTINDHLMSHGLSETPLGGFKQSGIEEHMENLIDDTQTITIVKIFFLVKKNLWWHPFSKIFMMD